MAAAESGFESIRQVTNGDIPGAATTLAEAFVDDPIKCYLVGRDEVPVATSVPFFKAFLKMQVPHGLTWMTRGFEAVSVWAPPDHWKVPTVQIARNMPTFLWLYRTRILQNLLVLNDIERRHPKEPHYYLEFVGTTPAAQGQGMGVEGDRPDVPTRRRRGRGDVPGELEGVEPGRSTGASASRSATRSCTATVARPCG